MILTTRFVLLAAFPCTLVACAKAPTPDLPTTTPSAIATAATPSATAPATATPGPSASAAAYETCVPGWSSGSIHSLRSYPHRALAQLPADMPPGGHFDTEGTVTAGYACPPCPPKAQCKPCAEPYAELTDGAAPALRVFLNSGAELPIGKKFRVSVVACAGHTPPRYELRGYVPQD